MDTLEEAADVLTQAFVGDPLIRYLLSGHESMYQEKVRELFHYQCLMYVEMELPIFGAVQDSRITGAACLSVPEEKERPASLVEADKKYNESVGKDSFERVQRFMRLSRKYIPDEPFHYLAALGVHPDYQGEGFGRLLLDEVHAVSEKHPMSSGVYLDTASLKNVEMYEYFGYRQIAQDKLDNIVDIWFMFRPTRKNV